VLCCAVLSCAVLHRSALYCGGGTLLGHPPHNLFFAGNTKIRPYWGLCWLRSKLDLIGCARVCGWVDMPIFCSLRGRFSRRTTRERTIAATGEDALRFQSSGTKLAIPSHVCLVLFGIVGEILNADVSKSIMTCCRISHFRVLVCRATHRTVWATEYW